MLTYGFVYVMINPCMPGIYKIGMTLRSPRQRAEELSSATGVPESFEVAYYAEVDSPAELESSLHQAFADRRVSDRREFFRAPLAEIVTWIRGYGIESESLTDMVEEALSPGFISPFRPLWFEESLHDPGYLKSISMAKSVMGVVS
jgi:hypothetical protein